MTKYAFFAAELGFANQTVSNLSINIKLNLMAHGTDEKQTERERFPKIGTLNGIIASMQYSLMIMFGSIRDFFATWTGITRYTHLNTKRGYSKLSQSWDSFYIRRMYNRLQDCWNRPIASSPGKHVHVMERSTTDGNCSLSVTGNTIQCLNLGSYNYLGFADEWNTVCGGPVMDTLCKWPITLGSSRMKLGSNTLHEQLEKVVAKFVGKEAAIVYAMGYGTNATTIPALMGQGCLIISDALNHISIVNGSRSSNAPIRVFKHNDHENLESILKEEIVQGQQRHHRPWKKILVMVEGIYSMEGALCNLKEIVRVCKKYKAYIYVDEAHSIGSLGHTGRGICEYAGVDPASIDILMGTFTKSFSGMGGYIAASQDIVNFIRTNSAGQIFHNSLCPIVTQQIIRAFQVIQGEDGSDVGKLKLAQLRENSNYFRSEMLRIGLHVYGDFDSPIIPVMIYMPAKVAAFSRECLKRGLAVVVVGSPSVSLLTARARFCLSAALNRSDLKYAVKVIDEVATMLMLKYNNHTMG